MKIKIFNKTTKIASASMLVASCLFAGAAIAKDTVKVGVVSFLTGPAAGVFGVPIGFVVIIVVSLLTPPPNKKIKTLVENIRYPELKISN